MVFLFATRCVGIVEELENEVWLDTVGYRDQHAVPGHVETVP